MQKPVNRKLKFACKLFAMSGCAPFCGVGGGVRVCCFASQLARFKPLEHKLAGFDPFRHCRQGKLRAGQIAVPACLAHVMKTGVRQTANIPPAIAAKDHDNGFVHYAAHGYPPQAVHPCEKVRHCHQKVCAVDLIELGKGPAAPAIGKGTECA